MDEKEDEVWTCRLRNPLITKPLAVVAAEEETDRLERTLSLVDLLAIGIGGTVGSGVFVLAGAIANAEDSPAGPAATLSFMAAVGGGRGAQGIGCIFSGLSFAEMASRVPSAGSSYAYAYVTLGELLAFVAGCCLTLEYGISSAAMARIWGEKLVTWMQHMGHDLWNPQGGTINVYAGVMETVCVLVMLRGVNLSKITINIFTVIKLLLVAFMTVGGFVLFNKENLRPFAPSGVDGVFRGALNCFFGYLGYDEVCCLAAEAKNPHRNIPLAVMGCIGGVTVLYVLATLSLVGMQPSPLISTSSGFSEAFRYNGTGWAAELVAVGELVTIPLVVLVSLLAQPRLQFAMALDGLLPDIFAQIDRRGNLFMGTLICGAVCVIIAIFLPFATLNDMISAGLLVAFNLTNTGLIIFRRGGTSSGGSSASSSQCNNKLCRALATLFNIAAIASAFLCVHGGSGLNWLKGVVYCVTFMIVLAIDRMCPEQHAATHHPGFTTPLVPWLPAIGVVFNWFLLAQLTWEGIVSIIVFIAVSVVIYFLYGYRYSVGARNGWKDTLSEAKRRRNSSGIVDPELVQSLLLSDAPTTTPSSSSITTTTLADDPPPPSPSTASLSPTQPQQSPPTPSHSSVLPLGLDNDVR